MNGLTLSVVSHGQGVLLDDLLRDLDTCDSLAGARVIVTLNIGGEAFDTRKFQRISTLVIRNEQPRGFGANHNAAFRHCDTPWFAVINPDLRIPSGQDPFRKLVACGNEDSQVALVVPVVLNSQGSLEDSVRRNLTPAEVFIRRFRARQESSNPSPNTFRWFAGMCMMFRASAFQSAGGFDERYFLYCEDYDICARLHLKGYKLQQVADGRVIHDAQRDSHRSSQHLRWHLGSLLRVWTSAPFWRLTLAGSRRAATTPHAKKY